MFSDINTRAEKQSDEILLIYVQTGGKNRKNLKIEVPTRATDSLNSLPERGKAAANLTALFKGPPIPNAADIHTSTTPRL